jgi:hypothetical protein
MPLGRHRVCGMGSEEGCPHPYPSDLPGKAQVGLAELDVTFHGQSFAEVNL